MPMKLDRPLEGCHARVEAGAEDEVMRRAAEHAASARPEMRLDEELTATFRSQITEG